MAEDQRAVDIIKLYEHEESKVVNFRSLFQDVSDYMRPRDDQITRKSSPGISKTDRLFDPTGVMAAVEMTSGLSQNLIAPGQEFFMLRMTDRELNNQEAVKEFLTRTTDTVHEQLFGSNFLLQLNESLLALVLFGTCNLYSEFTTALNFRDYDIGSYIILESSKRRVDTMLMKISLTARQAVQEWGKDVGAKILEATKDLKKQNDPFEFIYLVQPRQKRNPRLRDTLNMPFESLIVGVKDKTIISEGGFREFPHHVARWTRAAHEVFGRGQGTFALPAVKMLQQMNRDFIECANKHNNPPLEVLNTFDGQVKVFPGARNEVGEMGSIKALDRGVLGNFPITEKILAAQQQLVKNLFYNDVFVQLANLKGDRRTAVEIRERIAEGMHRLGPPIRRLLEELFTPLIERVVGLLARNGKLTDLPPELDDKDFEIEYIGRLAMELKSHQARGGMQLVASVAEIDQANPEANASDNINFDSLVRRLAETFGTNADDIASVEEVEAKRRQRAEQLAAQQQLQLAAMAAQGYKDTSKAAEGGSPAAELQEAIGA